jgi:hypothetical protein
MLRLAKLSFDWMDLAALLVLVVLIFLKEYRPFWSKAKTPPSRELRNEPVIKLLSL